MWKVRVKLRLKPDIYNLAPLPVEVSLKIGTITRWEGTSMGTTINRTLETETSSLFLWAPGTVYPLLQKVVDQHFEEIRAESLKAGVG